MAIVRGFLPGSPPAPDSSTERINSFFADNHGAIKAGAWIGVLATIFIVWWLATLLRQMFDVEDRRPRLAVISLTGIILAGGVNTVAIALYGGMAQRYQDLGDNAGLLWAIYSAMGAARRSGSRCTSVRSRRSDFARGSCQCGSTHSARSLHLRT
ncbi:MAG TPA: hypothetical protein VM282_09705 [Acidimicrobiales bacterium]|nr:hypothetical protein [Acidimicrobiales bacterium]